MRSNTDMRRLLVRTHLYIHRVTSAHKTDTYASSSTPLTLYDGSTAGTVVCPDFACCLRGASLLPNQTSQPVVFAALAVDNIPPEDWELDNYFGLIDPDDVSYPTGRIPEIMRTFYPNLRLFVEHLVQRYQLDGSDEWIPEWNVSIFSSDTNVYLKDSLSLPHFHRQPVRPPRDQPSKPESFHLYGMVYDRRGCIVYAFFPRYTVTDGGVVEWS